MCKHKEIKAQCCLGHLAGDQHYFGAEVLWYLKDHVISLALMHLREIMSKILELDVD